MKLNLLFVGLGILVGFAASLIIENMRLLAELKHDIDLYTEWEEHHK